LVIHRCTTLVLSSLLHLDATLLTGPQAIVSNDVSPNDVLAISWPAPINTNFLVAYRVSYTTSSAHSRRQTPSYVEVPAETTSTILPFAAFTSFTVDVDAVYTLPPGGNNVTVILLPPTTFTTPQRRKKLTLSRDSTAEHHKIKRGNG
jgi:hypothetical protein